MKESEKASDRRRNVFFARTVERRRGFNNVIVNNLGRKPMYPTGDCNFSDIVQERRNEVPSYYNGGIGHTLVLPEKLQIFPEQRSF